MLLPCRCNTRISKAASTPTIRPPPVRGNQPSQWVSFQSATWVRITPALTGGGYHLCPDLGGFSLSRGGARRLQPPHRWLVDGHHARHTTGARCSEHGAHDTATQGRDPPLRPGFAIHLDRVRPPLS